MILPKGGGKSRTFIPTHRNQKKLPGIIVVHENRGLNPYIEDVGRRAAGIHPLAPCFIATGRLSGNDDDADENYKKKRTREEMLEDFIAAYEYLKSHKRLQWSYWCGGFCFCGWIANMMAVKSQIVCSSVLWGQPTHM
jgi:carboxymethylenebutenolidase